jgi:hypothetical protein
VPFVQLAKKERQTKTAKVPNPSIAIAVGSYAGSMQPLRTASRLADDIAPRGKRDGERGGTRIVSSEVRTSFRIVSMASSM